MTICVVAHNYPSEARPFHHTFVKDHVDTLARTPRFTSCVVVPTPFAIPFTKRWKDSRSPILGNSPGSRAYYLSIPARRSPQTVKKTISRALLSALPPPENLIVHLHCLYPAGLALPQLAAAGYKTALTIHGTDWYSTIEDPRFKNILPEALYAADKICVSGPRLKQEIQRRFPDLAIEILYNYIDTDHFSLPDAHTIRAARKRLGFEADRRHFLTVANHHPEKGVDILLDAIGQLNRSDCCFHILGRKGSHSYEELLHSKMKQIPSGRVRFHPPVSRTQIPDYYHAADAFILPSRSEGFNVSTLEALSTGLPVLATRTGGAERVVSEAAGILLEPGSPSEIVAAIHAVLEHGQPARNQTSRQHMLNEYSFERYKTVLAGLYRNM
ncbi:MAG: glycosyltransferase family 4 protein [Cyclonatronaceae bacterium]